MDYLVSEAVTYYHEERPHQAKGNVPLVPVAGTPEKKKNGAKEESREALTASRIECRQRLGGLLKQYYRKAA
jgi:putative transposase